MKYKFLIDSAFSNAEFQINSAKWNIETKMITVVFYSKVIDLPIIQKKIATAGYDTELETADDKVYSKLHGCCQYERKNKYFIIQLLFNKVIILHQKPIF
ncbi:MAG: hypothetical protein JNL75_11325 [Chitinophagales bacterium]|nr:hypothetical protein [Chitinophagales bacterium]